MKTQPEEFDLVILGGGTGSTVAAWTFASKGKRVAVVERKYIGGWSPHIACLPSKNIIHSAKVASYFRRSKEFGITHDGFAIDMAGVRERKRRMVRGLNDCIWKITGTREPSSYWERAGSWLRALWKSPWPMGPHVNYGARMGSLVQARGPPWRQFPALPKHSRSRISGLLNPMKFPNTCLLSVGATSEWR